jgi:Flp pilus assembly protein TadG
MSLNQVKVEPREQNSPICLANVLQKRCIAMIARQCSKRPQSRYRLVRDCHAGIAVLVAVLFPVIIGFTVLSVEWNHIHFKKLQLQQTAQAASLAGANKLATYYTSSPNSTAGILAAAQAIANANIAPVVLANHTTVNIVPAANVSVGNWNSATATFTAGGTTPNAVQVVASQTAANHNAVSLLMGSMIGFMSFDMTATAVASFGTGQTFNTIVINDLTQSFISNILDQARADKSILDCINAAAGASSLYGITTFNGHPSTYQPLLQVSNTTNYNAIVSKINNMTSCNSSVTPYCSTGSNVAGGIYSAIQLLKTLTTAKNSIIIITDGVPSVKSGLTYALADGIGPTFNTSPTTAAICTTGCTDANLLTMAKNQAAAARAYNISISTIYYSGDTTASSSACTAAGLASSCTTSQLQTAYAASLASLSGGTGISLVAPSAGQISSTFAAFCSTMSSSVKQTR